MQINTQTQSFSESLAQYKERHKLTKDNIDETDWRYMPDKQWDKLLEGVDNYIDDFKENLKLMKEKQEEAANKAAAQAPSSERAIAAANAALRVAANGFVSGVTVASDSKEIEESSWTFDMKTEDQDILTRAKASNEMAAGALTKTQELLLTGSTSQGVSEASDTKEAASLKENDDDATWTITAFTPDGIICSEFKNGERHELWSINYNKSGDCKRVWDFLDRFDKDTDLKFASDKSFWEAFLAGNVDEDSIVNQYN